MREDRKRMEAGGEPAPAEESANYVGAVPENFRKWIRENAGRISEAEKRGTLPYFITDNRAAVDEALKPDARNPEVRKPEAGKERFMEPEVAAALGMEQGEEMSFEQANEMRGNPNYRKAVKYRVNCQSSVLANELRRRGFDVEAYGNTRKEWTMPSVLARKPEIAFMDADGNPPVPIAVNFNGDLLSSLSGKMGEPGRYHLRFRFSNDAGHVITAERLPDGTLRLYDPQSGKVIRDFSEYASHVKPDSFEYYRVDTLRVNPEVAKGTVKKAGSKGEAPRMSLPEITEFLEKGWYGDIKADVADYVKRRNAAQSNREKVALDKEMISNGGFIRSDYHSTAHGSIFATEELPKKISKEDLELSKNIQMARKMADNGYDCYLLSNPNNTKSADFIFVKKGKVLYTEGKLSTGKSSLDHNLSKGGRQAERILIDMTGTDDTNYIASQLQKAFEKNGGLKEVMLLKGKRMILVTADTASQKDFSNKFKKIWERSK